MHALRTRFKKEIVCEFLPPQVKSKKVKVIVFCPGMPSGSSKSDLLNFYSKKGYWVFLPRYRGSWESDGEFLKYPLEKDVLDVIDGISKGFVDFYSNTVYQIKPDKLSIIGSSFGGPAAILASKDKRVDRVVAISPVIDWRVEGKDEPLDWLEKFSKNAFGQAYRFTHKNWKKLSSGKFYNPINHVKELDGSKITIFQAKDDDSVPYRPAVKFAKLTDCKLFLFKKGGHEISKSLTKPGFYAKIRKLL